MVKNVDREYRVRNLQLLVKDRELLNLSDDEINQELRTLVDWTTNLSRLEEVDPNLLISITLEAKGFMQKTKFFSRDEGSFWMIFHELMDSMVLSELKLRNIDIDKLHYGLGVSDNVEYEYEHIPKVEYDSILEKYQRNWYKIVALLPPYRLGLHKNTFYVPGNRLNEFFEKRIYVKDDRYNRIVHIEPLSFEQYKQEIDQIKRRIDEYRTRKFATNPSIT